MKFIIYFLAFVWVYPNAQGQCLTNGTFATACDAEVTVPPNDACPTWTDGSNGTNNCGAGWIRSHGSPQMKKTTVVYEGGTDTIHYAFMIGDQFNQSEGIFTPYTFSQNQQYTLKFVYAAGSSNGTVSAFAANGLQQNVIQHCQETPPSISSKQLIGQFTATVSSQQQEATLTFIANNNFSQLWIYPSAGSSLTQLFLFSVQACPTCRSDQVIYKSGVIPGGNTTAGYIDVGSSAGTGGFGIVTVASGQATTLVASQQVTLLPSFQAVVTAGGSFIAQIAPCVSDQQMNSMPDRYARMKIPVQFGNADQMLDRPDVNTEKSSLIKIYPSVSNGVVHITGNRKILANADVSVTDGAGRNVYRTHLSGDADVTLDLGKLAGGLYFVQLRNGSQAFTQKIMINR